METLRVVKTGGRIKAAGMGMNHLFAHSDPVALEAHLKRLRDRPPIELLQAFFPSDHDRLRQLMRGVGFYRPVLKTDQGMAGNFLPFLIDPSQATSALVRRRIEMEEFVAIPEPHADLSPEMVREVQTQFIAGRLRETAERLASMERRQANKGRLPFFLIRPAQTDEPIVFGRDIVEQVERLVQALVANIAQRAGVTDSGLIWAQPDVFILEDGTIEIERLNCPDVGLFLRGFTHPLSRLLPIVQEIVEGLGHHVRDAIHRAIPESMITILTRDEVLDNEEDLLEIGEIEELQRLCAPLGKTLRVRRVSDVDDIPQDEPVLLLNLDYSSPTTGRLLARAQEGSMRCFPDPRFQRLCQMTTGLHETSLPETYRRSFLELAGANPKNDLAHREVLIRLNEHLEAAGHTTPILYVQAGGELIPVLRQNLHSWRQMKNRIERHDGPVPFRFRRVPATPESLLLTSSTGPRLHVYRFLCVRDDLNV